MAQNKNPHWPARAWPEPQRHRPAHHPRRVLGTGHGDLRRAGRLTDRALAGQVTGMDTLNNIIQLTIVLSAVTVIFAVMAGVLP